MTITYKDEFTEAEITLRPASLRDVFAHDDLEKAARKELAGLNEQDTDFRLYFQKMFVYPSCISCVHSGFIRIKSGAKGAAAERIDPRTIPFEKFIDLPNDLLAAWVDEAWSKNPNWKPSEPGSLEAGQEKGKKT